MASPDNHNDARRARTTTNSSILETASRFWQRSYAGDYLGLVILVVAYLLIGLFGQPFHQMFRLNDYRLQHPHAEQERVPVCEYSDHSEDSQLIHHSPSHRSFCRHSCSCPLCMDIGSQARHPQSTCNSTRTRHLDHHHHIPHRHLQRLDRKTSTRSYSKMRS